VSKIEQKKNFRVLEKSVKSDKVAFVFTAMGTKIPLYRLFVRALNKQGYTVVIYDYPLEPLFEVNLDEWEKFYADIITDAQNKITAYKQLGAQNFYAYGVSMGTLIANKFTRDTKDIKHVILNLTYGDVADNIWSYKGMRKTKASLMKQGIDKEGLRESVKYADPVTNAHGLRGKKVLLYLAKRDKVLIYPQTKATKAALEQAGVDLEYIESKYLGHWSAGAKHMLGIKKIKEFYNS
jgi:esterase/lipase